LLASPSTGQRATALSESAFDADVWQPVGGFADLTDYHLHGLMTNPEITTTL